MRARLLNLVGGVVRLALVVVALGLALGSIGLSAVRGFCPDGDTAVGAPLAAPSSGVVLATVVDPQDTTVDQDTAGTDGADAGTSQEPLVDGDGDGDPAGEDGAGPGEPQCEGGVERCLPPLLSSVLLVGDPACSAQAGAELRGLLVPAFVGATVLLAAAWGLRPGGRVDTLLRS